MERTSATSPSLASIGLALVLAAGCGSRAPSTPSPAADAPRPAPAATTTVTYTLAGVVRSVTPSDGQAVIAHEAIPGFMGAMTMPFTIKDRSLLEDIRPGDTVEGELRVQKEGDDVKDYELVDLVVTRPALPSPKKLTLSMQDMTLTEAPRRLEPGQPVPDFAVTTQDGKTLKLSDLRGKVVALTFVYTRCPLPDFCPLMDRKFSDLAAKVSASSKRAEQVRLLSVSFDPEHDTPEVLTKHARVQGARPPLWTFAVASHEELARVARPLGLLYGPGSNEIIHNLCTAVIDPEGRLAQVEISAEARNWQPAELLKLISSLVPDPTATTAPKP
jgi:protein SCO1/2